MKIRHITFFIFLCSSSAFSQTNDNDIVRNGLIIDSLIINAQLKDSVSKYYKYVYKAENAYMKKNYKKAAAYYEKAFPYIQHPFSGDLFNAIECEQKSYYNIDNLKKYVYLLHLKWRSKEDLYRHSRGLTAKDSIDIVKMIDTIKLKINTAISDELELMVQIDQTARFNVKYPLSKEDKKYLDSIDNMNYIKLIKLIDNNPIFTEDLIGVMAWGRNVNLLLMHNRSKLDVYIKLHPLVINGQLDARIYSHGLDDSNYLIENKYGCGERGGGHEVENWVINSSVYSYGINKEWENIINKYRKKLYLDDIETLHKKRIWTFRTGIRFYSMTTMTIKEVDFMKLIEESKYYDFKVKVYYKNKADEKRLKALAKEYYKNNSVKL